MGLPEGHSQQADLVNATGQSQQTDPVIAAGRWEQEDPGAEGGCGADVARVGGDGGDVVAPVASDNFWRPSLRPRRDEPPEITMETGDPNDVVKVAEQPEPKSRRGESPGSTMEASSLDDVCRAVDGSRPCAESGVKESLAQASLEEVCENDDCGRHMPSKVVPPPQAAPKQLGSNW